MENRNASRQCLGNGSWDTFTDYTECSHYLVQDSSNISLLIYAVGEYGGRVLLLFYGILLRLHPILLGTLHLASGLPLIQVLND